MGYEYYEELDPNESKEQNASPHNDQEEYEEESLGSFTKIEGVDVEGCLERDPEGM
jgi:hypothetical protein